MLPLPLSISYLVYYIHKLQRKASFNRIKYSYKKLLEVGYPSILYSKGKDYAKSRSESTLQRCQGYCS